MMFRAAVVSFCVSVVLGLTAREEPVIPVVAEQEPTAAKLLPGCKNAVCSETDEEGYGIGCENTIAFDAMMCESYMCRSSVEGGCGVEDWCMKACEKVQESFPRCRCPKWGPARKN